MVATISPVRFKTASKRSGESAYHQAWFSSWSSITDMHEVRRYKT
jgi:hypothetical protein